MTVNRLTTALAVVLFAATAVGCDSTSENSRTFTNGAKESEITFTYYYKGDTITRQDTQSKITYRSMGAADEAQARQSIEPMVAHYAGVKGAKYSAEYQPDAVLLRVSVNFSEVSDRDLCKLQGKEADCEKPSLSMAESAEHRLAQGFVEVK